MSSVIDSLEASSPPTKKAKFEDHANDHNSKTVRISIDSYIDLFDIDMAYSYDFNYVYFYILFQQKLVYYASTAVAG